MEVTLVEGGTTVGWEDFAAAGITYRKLDYWTKHGHLRPVPGPAGSGHVRRWPAAELAVAILIDRLTAAGLRLDVAHSVARHRRGVGAGDTTFGCDIAPGIQVTVGPAPQPGPSAA